MKKLLAAAAMSAALMGSAHAFTITSGSAVAANTVLQNDFISPTCVGPNCILNGYSLFAEGGTWNVTGLNASDVLNFTAIGAEAGFINSFYINNILKFTETSWDGGHPQIELYSQSLGNYTVSSITAIDFRSSGGFTANSTQSGFGVFFNPGNVNSVVFAFDDHNPVDDNHDDLLIRVSYVPEPATWGLMILGFAGLAMARRRALRPVKA